MDKFDIDFITAVTKFIQDQDQLNYTIGNLLLELSKKIDRHIKEQEAIISDLEKRLCEIANKDNSVRDIKIIQ